MTIRMKSDLRSLVRSLAFVAVAIAATGSIAAGASAATYMSETGSTLLYPILTVWIERFESAHGDVRIDAAATGSGDGIRAAVTGRAELGGTDAYLDDRQMQQHDLLNVPLAVSAQEVAYNVPELRGAAPLRLTGPVLAGMYDGSITTWDDRRIAALNPGRTLPHHGIVLVHRTDGSGDTFYFTQYLSRSTPAWDRNTHFGTRVHWPSTPSALEGTGNAGMIETCANASYSVAYIGISYAGRASAAGLDVAAVQNRSGAFVLPTVASTRATAEAMAAAVPDDGRLSLVYSSGPDAYPLVNFEYVIVKVEQSVPGTAAAMRDFLNWIVAPDGGNDATLLASVSFAPLPARVRSLARREISTITGP
jgi:phosphate transport system substrate-binding protein